MLFTDFASFVDGKEIGSDDSLPLSAKKVLSNN